MRIWAQVRKELRQLTRDRLAVALALLLPLIQLTLMGQSLAFIVRDLPVVGEQLCQQHCPVSHVAHEFPQLCEAETEAIGRVLGRHVQRLATIAHGDGVCTTCIPNPVETGTTEKKEQVTT